MYRLLIKTVFIGVALILYGWNVKNSYMDLQKDRNKKEQKELRIKVLLAFIKCFKLES